MKKSILLLLLLISLIGYSQDIIENKSEIGLDVFATFKDSTSNVIIGTKADVYIEDSFLKSIPCDDKGEITVKLITQNEYKLIFSKVGYDSFVFHVDTRMSTKQEQDSGSGWSFPCKGTLNRIKEKGIPNKVKVLKIVYDAQSNIFIPSDSPTYGVPEIKYDGDDYNIATRFFEHGKYKSAKKYFTKEIDKNPNQIDSYYGRGFCYLKLGNKEAACKDWMKCEELGNKEVKNLIKTHCGVMLH